MRKSAIVLLVAAFLLSAVLNAGYVVLKLCAPPYRTALQATAQTLRPSMHQNEVVALFAKFESSEDNFTGGISEGGSFPATFFQTNVTQGTRIRFEPREIGVWDEFEQCTVYFDTNEIIAACSYSRS